MTGAATAARPHPDAHDRALRLALRVLHPRRRRGRGDLQKKDGMGRSRGGLTTPDGTVQFRDDIYKRDGVNVPSTIEAPTPVASAASTQPEVFEPGDEEN